MSLNVKICGLKDIAAVDAAVDGGALYAGFVFYPKSVRAVSPQTARSLCRRLPSTCFSVGLFVDPDDKTLTDVLDTVPLTIIQLHGDETPARVRAIKEKTGRSIIKAIGINNAEDLDAIPLYENVADMLLLDARPSKAGGYGGRGEPFDWKLLKKASFSKPWILAGGLCEENLAEAVSKTDASILDVSSGVEGASGEKDPERIRAFLKKAHQIETCC